jgi:hypothetical protein
MLPGTSQNSPEPRRTGRETAKSTKFRRRRAAVDGTSGPRGIPRQKRRARSQEGLRAGFLRAPCILYFISAWLHVDSAGGATLWDLKFYHRLGDR